MSGRPGQRTFGSIRRLPSGRYQARYRDRQGQWHNQTFDRKADADVYLAEVRTDLARGTWRNPKDGRITLADYAKEWLASDPVKAPTTLARDETVIRKHVLPTLGALALSDITSRDVQRIINEMSATLAPKTVLTNAGVLRALLHGAVLDDRLYVSPYRQPKLPSPVASKKRRLTMPEQRRLAEALPSAYGPMVFLAGVLGLRLSEVIGLRVGDIDFLGRPPTIRVNCPLPEVSGKHVESKGKTPGSKTPLTLPSFLVAILAEHLAATSRRTPERFVFEAPKGGPLHAANFRTRTWHKAIQETGFSGLTFHGLRHSASGLMRQIGAHDQLIQQRMRHTHRPTTTDIYGWVPDQADVAVNVALDELYIECDLAGKPSDSSLEAE
ncbi:MAG: hypothetical protein QOG97_3657 [Acidimicrobiaceae bacterium]|jgi:integrase|nr:hypothetical protein [Acidimicrobiaceae bacterium]